MGFIQDAIKDKVSNGGGTVLIPSGTHIIEETLVLDGDRVQLVGEGASSKIVAFNAEMAVLEIHGEHHRVSNLTISRRLNPTQESCGIFTDQSRFVRFDNIHFESHGVGLKVGSKTQFIHTSNCWFTGGKFDSGIHFLGDDERELNADYTVNGCFIEPGNRGIVMSGNSNGIFISDTSVINGGPYNYGIVSEGNGFARYILGCNIENALQQQIFIGPNCNRITVANCWLGAGDQKGDTRSGIQIEPGADTIKIMGNRIGDQRLFGILSRGNNVIIQGNDLNGNVNTSKDLPSILIEGGNHILLTGNRVRSEAQSSSVRLQDFGDNMLSFCMIQGNDLISRKGSNEDAQFNGGIQNQSNGEKILIKDNFDESA